MDLGDRAGENPRDGGEAGRRAALEDGQIFEGRDDHIIGSAVVGIGTICAQRQIGHTSGFPRNWIRLYHPRILVEGYDGHLVVGEEQDIRKINGSTDNAEKRLAGAGKNIGRI